MEIKKVFALTLVGYSNFSYKYSSKSVQFTVCCLKYGLNYKAVLFYQCLEAESNIDQTGQIIQESFKWLYGSFKQRSLNINHSYWLQNDINRVEVHQNAISRAISGFGVSNFSEHSLNINQYDPALMYSDIKTIFALDQLIPTTIFFNDKGMVDLKLKDNAIDLLIKCGLIPLC